MDANDVLRFINRRIEELRKDMDDKAQLVSSHPQNFHGNITWSAEAYAAEKAKRYLEQVKDYIEWKLEEKQGGNN